MTLLQRVMSIMYMRMPQPIWDEDDVRGAHGHGHGHGHGVSVIREHAVSIVVGVELHLDAIRKRVIERRLDSSRAVLQNIEARAKAGLIQSQETLERHDEDINVIEKIANTLE